MFNLMCLIYGLNYRDVWFEYNTFATGACKPHTVSKCHWYIDGHITDYALT